MGDVYMPRLSDSMQEGVIAVWLKEEGEQVSRGDEIVDIETDKATMAFEADESGTLHILEPAGSTVPVGSIIATIGDGSARKRVAEESSVSAGSTSDVPTAIVERKTDVSRPSVSPLARKLAKSLGVDIATVVGTGLGGRVLRSDIESAAQQGVTSVPSRNVAVGPSPTIGSSEASNDGQILELSQVQKIIAQRMVQTKSSVPEFSVTCDVDMDSALSLQDQLRSLSGASAPAPSINDLVVKAAGLALRQHPRVNGRYVDDALELNSLINVGIAVAVDGALFVPVVAEVDRLPIGEVAVRTRELVGRVRDGVIAPTDLTGGTFTISNLGMFGVTDFTAIINASQAAILSVGAIRKLPMVRNGSIVAGSQMRLTLTCDHRVLYGSDAAHFLQTIRGLLETPLSLVAADGSGA